MYGVFDVAFGLMASAIAVTAFRRGDGWAWWALLVGNTIALDLHDHAVASQIGNRFRHNGRHGALTISGAQHRVRL
jgi:predicted DCC family thiol-disulfide oxidoreductase YuxK